MPLITAMVIGQIKDTVLPVNNGVIPASCGEMTGLWVHPSTSFFVIQVADTGIQFSNKYLRNLLNEKKGKRSPVGG